MKLTQAKPQKRTGPARRVEAPPRPPRIKLGRKLDLVPPQRRRGRPRKADAAKRAASLDAFADMLEEQVELI